MRNSKFTQFRRRLTLNRIVILSIFIVPLYNEFLSYAIYSLLWPGLHIPDTTELRILFVADPQLIGLHDEPPTFSHVSRWDSDRYLRKTFQMAYSHMDPDVIVYLGDIFDEGSTASLKEFKQYHDRLRSIFYTGNKTQHIFVSGDNDVGGEGIDPVTEEKVFRFDKFLNGSGVTTVKFADFVRLHLSYHLTDDTEMMSEVKKLASRPRTNMHLILNHMQLLEMQREQFRATFETLQPSIIFSAHIHKASLYTCLDCWTEEHHNKRLAAVKNQRIMQPIIQWEGAILKMQDYSVYELEVNDGYTLHEIVVPTCSYRMGVPTMGYGAAVIGANNRVKYTVLWTPSRYHQLYLYIVWLFFLTVFCVIRLCMFTCSTILYWYATRRT